MTNYLYFGKNKVEILTLFEGTNLTLADILHPDKVVNQFGETAVFFIQEEEQLRYLLHVGHNINHKNVYGESVLHKEDKSHEMLELFILYGAFVDIRDHDGYTPFLESRDLGIMKLFLKHGANVNARNHHGKGFLDFPIDQEKRNFLIENGYKV